MPEPTTLIIAGSIFLLKQATSVTLKLLGETEDFAADTAGKLFEAAAGNGYYDLLKVGSGKLLSKTWNVAAQRLASEKGENGKPLNHDLLKAFRRAQLNSTLKVCESCWEEVIEKETIESGKWKSKFLALIAKDTEEKKWLRQVVRFLNDELKSIDDLSFLTFQEVKNEDLLEIARPDYELNKCGETKLLTRLQESTINELRLWNPPLFEQTEIAEHLFSKIKNGWEIYEKSSNKMLRLEDNSLRLDWYELLCALFNEEYKINPRVNAALGNLLFYDLKGEIKGQSQKFIENHFNQETAKINETLKNLDTGIQEIAKEITNFVMIMSHYHEINVSLHQTTHDELKILNEKIDKLFSEENFSIEFFNRLILFIQSSEFKPSAKKLPTAPVGGEIDYAKIGRVDFQDDENSAVEIITVINKKAALLYRNAVLDERNKIEYGGIWRNFWQPGDLEVQKNYISTRLKNGEFVKDKIFNILDKSVKEREIYGYTPPAKIWLVGGAGVGKTSSLYRTFFKLITTENSLPIPLLLQPRLFDETAVNRLDDIENNAEFLKELIIIWLENRNVRLEADVFSRFLADLQSALHKGDIVIFIDSYDELARFKFQKKVFDNLLSQTQICVCASRPETYDNKDENELLIIEDTWEFDTVKRYLRRRLTEDEEFIYLLSNYISKNHSMEWLRNPRYLGLFVDILYRSEIFRSYQNPEKSFWELLGGDEYGLLKKIHSDAVERLRRNLLQASPLKTENRDDFFSEITDRFIRIAHTELEFGTLNLPENEQKNDLYWKEVFKATEFVIKPFFNREAHAYELKFSNYNFVDYFLTEELAFQIYTPGAELKNIHQWSNTLVRYLTQFFIENQEISAHSLETEIKRKLQSFVASKLINELGCRTVTDFESKCCFMGINLMKLLIRLIIQDKSGKFSAEFREEKFLDIYLDGVDFSNLKFTECDFSGSSLATATLDGAEFYKCVFNNTNLRNSHALGTKFSKCTFNFSLNSSKNSSVRGMILQEAELDGCRDEKGEIIELEKFVAHEAKIKESRYAGEFGKRFRKNMSDFLGEGVENAEDIYVRKIQESLASTVEEKDQIYVIDVMAGDMSRKFKEGILEKFNRSARINLFAIDKDAKTINQDVKFSDSDNVYINIWEKEICGRLDLKKQLKSRFEVDGADAIIGKKMLHELLPMNQRELLEECGECLNPEGRMILYADSPEYISEEGFENLSRLVEHLRGNQSVYHQRKLLIDDLDFNGDVDDSAVFLNLWIAIKDYANDNRHELQNRYFSSVNQIKRWSEQAGLEIYGQIERENCNLAPKIFNEIAFGKICSFLDSGSDVIHPVHHHWIEETLFGSEKHQLLRDFTEKHLWNEVSRSPTQLGKKLQARKEDINFKKIHGRLADFSFLDEKENKDISFILPVHVFAFGKRFKSH